MKQAMSVKLACGGRLHGLFPDHEVLQKRPWRLSQHKETSTSRLWNEWKTGCPLTSRLLCTRWQLSTGSPERGGWSGTIRLSRRAVPSYLSPPLASTSHPSPSAPVCLASPCNTLTPYLLYDTPICFHISCFCPACTSVTCSSPRFRVLICCLSDFLSWCPFTSSSFFTLSLPAGLVWVHGLLDMPCILSASHLPLICSLFSFALRTSTLSSSTSCLRPGQLSWTRSSAVSFF